jgi:hypothetical protein
MVSASKVVVDSLQSVISLTDQMIEDPNPSSGMKEAVKMAQVFL